MLGVGESSDPHSRSAGADAARRARRQLGAGVGPGWVLAFCGGRHDPAAFLQGVAGELGPVPVVGGAAVGAITGGLRGVTGYECAVAVFPDTLPPTRILPVPGLDQDEVAAGRRLGELLQQHAEPGCTVLLFYDSVRSYPPPVLHVANRLMDGVYRGLGALAPTIVGAGTLQYFELTASYVFAGDAAVKHTAVAVVLPPVLQSRTAIMHGCVPASSFMEITRIEGAKVYELDGRPAAQVLAERLGRTPETLVARELSFLLTLGEKHGDPFAAFDESNYVNRLVIASDPQAGSITLFEADFQAGTRVQVMVTDADRMCRSVEQRTRELLSSLGGRRPAFALYIDCAARASAFSGSAEEEADLVRSELGPGLPLIGFYSGVEIAPLLGRARPLDWTGVLTVFTRGD